MTPKVIRFRQLRYHWTLYLFILPALLLIALFQYYPAASGLFHSFFRWNGADISEFNRGENYTDILSNSEFWQSFKVAFLLGAWNILKMIPAIAIAVAIHRCRSTRMQFLYRALFVIPMVIPGLVIVLIWRSFFFEATNGYLNRFLDATGILGLLQYLDRYFEWGQIFVPGQNPAWLGDPRLILIACVVWGFPWVGSFAVLTHLAKLQNIGKEIYEAGDIDGVGWWKKFTAIELPLMMSSIHLLLVFVIIDTIKDAGMILALAGFEGGPGGAATVPALFMIRKAFIDQQMGYACAVGVVLTLIVLGLQKISQLLVNWDSFNPSQRRNVRLGAMLAGVALMAISWWTIGLAIFLIAFPYALIGKLFVAITGKQEESVEQFRLRQERAFVRATDPAFQKRKTAVELLLRLVKHGFIWGVLAFAFLPLYLMLIVSLKDNTQFYREPATLTAPYHWENWRTAWDSILPSVANSIFISISTTFATLCLALSGAYFFARAKLPFSGLLWNAILILLMMPAIANLVPLFRLLGDLNLLNTLSALILVGTSGGQVFGIFVLRNFVADIPQDLFEAAEIDGASHFQQLRVVVAPLSGPILGTVGVMTFVGAWNEFVLPLIVMRDASQLPVMVQLLRLAGEYIKLWGPLMAGYTLASLPIIILFMFSMKLFVKGLTEGAVKG